MHSQKVSNNSPQIRCHLFGRFRILRGADSVQLPTRKTESLFAYLLLNPRPQGREKLAALFWGDSSDADARNSLRNALAMLNKKLGRQVLLVDRQSVSTNPDFPVWVDALAFEVQAERYLGEPITGPPPAELSLYQDDLLPDLYDDWLLPLRDHYRSLYTKTLLQAAQHMRSQSEYEKAIQLARQVLAVDPANERAHQHLMFCHTASGNRSAAIKQYEECRRALIEEMGVEPAPETTALYEWIRQEPANANPLEARLTNLPIPLTTLIGRKHELNELRQLFAATRLLTLTGSGGSGKTRLAVQLGTDLLDTVKDGVWWVDLSALTDAALVTDTIAKALGVRGIPNQSLDETLANYLRSSHTLMILDNCEHLIQPCAVLVQFLLERCSQLKVLATSRQPLNIPGEQTWLVPALSLPDPQRLTLVGMLLEYEGIRLFVERARAAWSEFTLTDQNAPFVAQVCLRLDGIPLALELAAARVKILTIEQIASRLDDRFQLLTSASQAAPPRYQTLRAVLDWSYTLLDEREQRLFRSLGVFSGGWDLDAAESVCVSGGKLEKREILGLLASLVDKSLVERERDSNSKSRYRMLETIRQYAQEALVGTGEALEVQNRHLGYYLHLAQAPKPHLGFFQTDSQTLEWLQVLSLEHDNLRAAQVFCQNHPAYTTEGLKMAGVLHWYFLAQNHLAEGLGWIQKLQAQGASIPAPVQAQVHLTAGFLACWLGDFASACPYLETSLNLYAGLENLAGVAFSQHGLGFAANGLGQHAQAELWFEQCLTTARQIDDQWLISIALHFIAVGSSFQAAYELARTQFIESINYMKQGKGTYQGLAFSEFHLGRISRIQGDLSSAYAHHVEGLKIFAQMGDRRGLVYSFFGFACLAQSQGQLQRAARLLGALDNIRERLGTLLEAVLEAEYGQVKTATLEALGKEQFQAAWTEGRGMSLEHAIQFALNPG